MTPARLADTRSRPSAACGSARATGGASPSSARGGVPDSDVTAVALNVTVTNPTTTGFLTVYPKGNPTPNASNLNYVPRPDRRQPRHGRRRPRRRGHDRQLGRHGGRHRRRHRLVPRAPRSPSRCSTARCCPPEAPRAPGGFQIPPGTWPLGAVPSRPVRWRRAGRPAPGSGSGRPARCSAPAAGAAPDARRRRSAPTRSSRRRGAGPGPASCRRSRPAPAVGDGDWVISEDLVPGVYQSSGAAPCRWEQLMGFTGASRRRHRRRPGLRRRPRRAGPRTRSASGHGAAASGARPARRPSSRPPAAVGTSPVRDGNRPSARSGTGGGDGRGLPAAEAGQRLERHVDADARSSAMPSAIWVQWNG